jgi:PAS domain-containing protein
VLTLDPLQDFITQEYQESVKEVLDNALKGCETANFEFPLYTKDRRRVDVLLNATTRRDVDGKVIGVIGVGQDITERKQVEVEKTRVAQELQTFIDTANAPIFGIDARGLINEWNNKAAAITGFSRLEVLGKNLVQVHGDFTRILFLQSLECCSAAAVVQCCSATEKCARDCLGGRELRIINVVGNGFCENR